MDRTSPLDNLKARHILLDREIMEESQRPLPDSMTIQALKRQKLQVRAELSCQTAP